MRHLFDCRRTYIATLAIGCLVAVGWTSESPSDVAMAISTVAVGLAGANAYQKRGVTNDE